MVVIFERSPMYHAIILEDLLDLLNLCKSFPRCHVFNANFDILARSGATYDTLARWDDASGWRDCVF